MKEQMMKRLKRLEHQLPPDYIPLMHEAMTAASECDRAALDAVRAKLSTLDETGATFVGRFIDAAQTTLDMEVTP